MITANARRRRIESAIFLVPFITYAYFYQGADQSVACRFDLVRAILERHSLWIDGFCGYNTADIISLGGHYYSVKAPGGAFTALIPWTLISNLLLPLYWRNDAVYWAFTTYLTTLFTSGAATAAASVVMYRFARHFGVSEGRSAGVAMLFALGTIAFPYATELTGEPIAGAAAFASFYLVATMSPERRAWRAFAAGFLAGWAVLNDYPSFLMAAAIGIYALFRMGKLSHLAAFSAGAFITALILFGYNWGAFGHLFFFSYQAYSLPGNNQFPEQAVGFVGLTYPKLYLLWNILVDPQRGLFFCNPALLLAIPGVMYFARQRMFRAELSVTIFAVVAMILFNASYGASVVSWGGGTATGPRQIIAITPFITLPIVFLPAACDVLIGGLGGLSAWVMLMATATNPHFPYEYENPVREFALQLYLRGDFAMNRDTFFGGGMIARDSVAFNLGKILRIPGPLQLWPLAGIWILGAQELIEATADSLRPRKIVSTAIALGIAAMFIPSIIGFVARPVLVSGTHGLLGRYYFGDEAAQERPRLVRIDRQIDFDDITAMGAVPFPSVAVWSGQLIVPRAGDYEFQIEVDDSGWLKIDGKYVIRDPGNVNVPDAEGRIDLDAGTHRIEVGERNVAGGSYIHLLWQLPDANTLSIVPADVLVPDRP
jgi:hypothetical protein